MEFIFSRGNIYIVGELVDEIAKKNLSMVPHDFIINQQKRDNNKYHITFITKDELNKINQTGEKYQSLLETLNNLFKNNDDKLKYLGLGNKKDSYFQVIIFSLGNKFRKKLELGFKDFHITVGFKDSDAHDIKKNYSTIIKFNEDESIGNYILDYAKDRGNDAYLEAMEILQICDKYIKTDQEKYMRDDILINCYFKAKRFNEMLDVANGLTKYKNLNSMILYYIGVSYYLNKKYVQCYINLKRCIKFNEDENILLDVQIEKINKLLKSSSKNIRFNADNNSIIMFDKKKISLPRNFSYVIPGLLAGSSLPKIKDQFIIFDLLNIKRIFTVMDEKKLDPSLFEGTDIQNTYLPVKNTMAPSFEQVDLFIALSENLIEKGNGVLVHCGGGVGRAGCFLCCFILKNGQKGTINRESPTMMNSDDAIKFLRELRPKSIETKIQEKFIRDYSDYLWKKFNDSKINSYPTIYHLPYSEGINNDDKIISEKSIENFLYKEVVITEKIDGGNCCLFEGKVYARTHSKEANHESFGPIKELYYNIKHKIPQNLMIFGENLTGIHTIEYTFLTSYFYIFSVYDTSTGFWLSWDDTVSIANSLDIPTVPILFRGYFYTEQELKNWFEQKKQSISKLHNISNIDKIDNKYFLEGFVIRKTQSFTKSEFNINIAKWVKYDHIQNNLNKPKNEDWKKFWKKNKIYNISKIPKKIFLDNLMNNFNQDVFKRDNFMCRIKTCQKKQSNNCPLYIHHITSNNELPNGGFVLSNGITLCLDCKEEADFYHESGNRIGSFGYWPEDLYEIIGSSYEQALEDSYKIGISNIKMV